MPACREYPVAAIRPRFRLFAAALLATAGWPIVAQAEAPAPPAAVSGPVTPDDTDQNAITVRGRPQRGAVATDVKPEVELNAQVIKSLDAADLAEVFQSFSGAIGGSNPVVLVNGQRITGFQTIQSLPPEAVLRIEVFPEKVALQYGYRPDQRVVNVILREPYRALSLLGRTNVSTDNGRGIYRAKADLAQIGATGHGTFDIDFRHMGPVNGEDTVAGPFLAPAGSVPARTVAAQSDQLTLLGDLARTLGDVTAEGSARLDLTGVQARPGLSDSDAAQLEAQGSPELVVPPARRTDTTVDANAGLTLNGRLDTWRWSFVGTLDETTRQVRTGTAAGEGAFAKILLPSPTLLGDRCRDFTAFNCAATTTRTAGGDAFLNGDLFAMPAGTATLALRAGGAASDVVGTPPPGGAPTRRTRDEGNVQGNLDVPITAAEFALGKLTAGVNGEVRQLSDIGTLPAFGSTLDWLPDRRVEVLASFNQEQVAPTLAQLGSGVVVTPELRAYDFVTGQTTIVSRIDGGNPLLRRQRSDISKVRVQVKPLTAVDLAVSGEYTSAFTRDPIAVVSAVTDATEAAFPTRFTRSATGFLTALDASPLNLRSRDTQTVRWGLTYTGALGRGAEETADGRTRQLQLAFYDTWTMRDRVVLADGQPSLDLLGGDIINDTGGTPRHRLELQASLVTGGFSVNVNTNWGTPTTAVIAGDRLTFSAPPMLNLRFRIKVPKDGWVAHHVPFVHGSINIAADNILSTHVHVRDANGGVPLAYQSSYVNPTGRTFRITFRKRFR